MLLRGATMKTASAILQFEDEVQATLPEIAQNIEARPFLKWAGGKGKLLPAILPLVPDQIENYHEPFLGSGAVFFAVTGKIKRKAYLCDLNDELVNAWQVVRDLPEELMDEAQRYLGLDREEDYYRVRADVPEGKLPRAARFFYLNQTAWNGLWRVNKHGVFNVPWGARPFRGLDPNNIFSASQVLRNAEIDHHDFRDAIARAKPGDFVYLDPPYLPASDTSKFCFYTKKRFRVPDLEDLSALCEKMTADGINWMMSNRDNELIQDLFSHAKIVPFKTWRSVSAQNRRNVQPASSPEVVVVGGPACQ